MDKILTEQEYRAYPALNSTALSSFYNKGVNSPDHALMKFDYKSYFEYGKMFETMLQDAATGSKEFEKRFYLSGLTNAMPEKLIEWIDNKEELTDYYEYTKAGKLSGTYKGRHAYLDEAIKNPGKIPVSQRDGDMLERHTDNMMKMQYGDHKVSELLGKAQWQVPVTFVDFDDIEKKALLDCLVSEGEEQILIDIKTTASFQKFGYFLRDKYFIQDLLYTHAVNAKFGYCRNMVFFAASKEAPYLCAPFEIDYGGVDFKCEAVDGFFDLCKDYKKWNDSGRLPVGWLPTQTVKKYPAK